MIVRHLFTHPVRYAVLLAVAVLFALPGATHQAGAAESTALLPDLVADAPTGIGLSTSTNSSTHVTSYLLRFNGYIHNKGPGALDIRGTRVAKTLSEPKARRVKEAEEKKEPLGSPEIEEELAGSPMKTFQRVFTTKAGQEETNIERAHEERTSMAQLLYSSADGHNHWHLQYAAKYSLWNAAKTAESALAQKVGFCLDDSEHVETDRGPSSKVYADQVAPFRDFCQQYHPNATSLFEGISPGWRDLYDRELAFQWVDVSEVLPGEYWLREEVNPLGVIEETGGANVPVYAPNSTIIPGFDALAQGVSTGVGEAKSITLTAKAWEDNATPKYAIVSQPQHGTLSAISQGKVLYTPNAGYSGVDSFTFSAADPNSQFPTHPDVATVSLVVGEALPTVAIEGAPASMTAGTSVSLSAHVENDSQTVTWEASAGSITPGGVYTAPSEPPASGKVTIGVTTARGAKDERTIAILAPAPDEPAPEAPAVETPTGETHSSESTPGTSSSGTTGGGSSNQQSTPGAGGVLGEHTTSARISIARPTVILFGRSLVMTALPSAAGSIRLSAFLGARRLGSCATLTRAEHSFTCRIPLAKGVSTHARIRVQATLRDGSTVARSVRPAAPVAPMRMGTHGAQNGLAAVFWCSPAALRGLSVRH